MSINYLIPDPQDGQGDSDNTEIRPFSLYNSTTHRSKPIALIVAVGHGRAIGRKGDLIWHLSDDLKRFKALTMGHPVIMGRKTWESLPKGALPGRRNIVLTRNGAYEAPGAETASSVEEALTLCSDDPMPFIIGGAQIYAESLPLATRLFLTEVEADCADADAFFPEIDITEWHETARSDRHVSKSGIPFTFIDLARK